MISYQEARVIFWIARSSPFVCQQISRIGLHRTVMSSQRNPGFSRLSDHGNRLSKFGFELVSVDEENVEAVVKHPGMTHSDFDVLGQPKIWQMMSLVVSSRFFAHHYPLDDSGRTFRDYEKLTSDCLIFLVTSQLTFTKDLYNRDLPKRPLFCHVRGGHIGNSSMNSLTSLSTENGELLIENVNHAVCIDKDTRRPKPLPDWWKEKYAESAKGKPALRFAKFVKPELTGHFRVTVAWSDTDLNHHTTWTAYMRYVIDAAHKCQREGTLKTFDDNLKEGVKKLELQYFGENLEGDCLDVYVLEDNEDKKLLRAEIFKDDISKFQCTLTFF